MHCASSFFAIPSTLLCNIEFLWFHKDRENLIIADRSFTPQDGVTDANELSYLESLCWWTTSSPADPTELDGSLSLSGHL